MRNAPAPASLAEVDSDPGDDVAAWLLAVHHEIGNHLAALRFAAQLTHGFGEPNPTTAAAMDRAAMQAGSLLALARPLLLIDTPELETIRVEVLFEAFGRELAAQGQPAPTLEIESGLPPLCICLEALQPALTAIGLRNESEQPARLRATSERGGVLLHLQSQAKAGGVERERLLVLRLVERLMDRCSIPFAVHEADVMGAEFWCQAAG